MKKTQGGRTKRAFKFLCLMGALALNPIAVNAGSQFSKDSYEVLEQKACEAAAHGSLAAFHSSEAELKAMAASKTSTLDGFYSMAASYGHDDIDGSSAFLKNEVRLNWDIKQLKRPLAEEALLTSEASIKFFLNKDKVTVDPKYPPLTPGYESQVLALVGQAEGAFAAGQYAKMRNLFYHAIWIAYPVTSKAPFTEPK